MRRQKIQFRTQVPIATRRGTFTADFVVGNRLVVECEGAVHASQIDRDNEREELISEQGFAVLRFANFEIFENVGHVLDKIRASLGSSKIFR